MDERINLRQIEAFRAVMVGGSMTEAGRMLNISQPSISRLVADLERRVGFALFERRHGRVAPTAEAVSLYEEVERSYSGIAKIAQTAREIRSFGSGRLTIAAMPALSLDVVPDVLSSMLEAHPNLLVTLHTRSSQRILNWMQAQRFDLGIAGPPFDQSGVERLFVVTTPCVCVLPTGHPLTARDRIRPLDLKGETLLTNTHAQVMRHDLERLFESEGFQPRVRVETPLSFVAGRMAERGAGIALIEPFTARYIQSRAVELRLFDAPLTFTVGVLAPGSRTPSRIACCFAELLEAHLLGETLPCGIRPSIAH